MIKGPTIDEERTVVTGLTDKDDASIGVSPFGPLGGVAPVVTLFQDLDDPNDPAYANNARAVEEERRAPVKTSQDIDSDDYGSD